MNHDTNYISRLKSRDVESFTAFFNDYKELVFNTTLHLLQNEEESKDVMQDVFIDVFQSIDRFDERSSITTWLYRICINKSLNILRRRKLRNAIFSGSGLFESTQGGNWVHPGVILENKEKAKKLYAAIAKLKNKEQVSFTLFHIQGLSQKEVAEITEQSISAVETQIFRAKQKLSQWLIDEKL